MVSGLLGRMGLISSKMMKRWRRHAVVAILIVSAIITPTTDAFTLMIVALPIWLLYELSIIVVRWANGASMMKDEKQTGIENNK